MGVLQISTSLPRKLREHSLISRVIGGSEPPPPQAAWCALPKKILWCVLIIFTLSVDHEMKRVEKSLSDFITTLSEKDNFITQQLPIFLDFFLEIFLFQEKSKFFLDYYLLFKTY